MKNETPNIEAPIVAFFGTKGGVGKTSIMDKFASLVVQASGAPNILLVDFDVHHRGLTVLRTRNLDTGNCRTIHEYIADMEVGFQSAINITPKDVSSHHGGLFLIPSSSASARNVFSSVASQEPRRLSERIRNILASAVEKYHINLVLIDCGPIVDPLTASATMIADTAFIIGQNEPISFQALQNYVTQIKDFFPDFESGRVKVVLNKVRGPVLQGSSIYAAIPFTMELIDYSEGLPNIDEIRLIYFDHCIYEIVRDLMENMAPELVPGPEATLTPTQREAIDTIPQFTKSRWFRKWKTMSHILWVGLVLMIGGAVIVALLDGFASPQGVDKEDSRLWFNVGLTALGIGAISAFLGGFFFYRMRRCLKVVRLFDRSRYAGMLQLLKTRAGRKRFMEIQILSKRTEEDAR